MKKSKNLSIVLYVFVILSLIYTCYVLFTSYGAFSSYYGEQAGVGQMLGYVIGNAYAPLMMTVILYALVEINEIVRIHFLKEDKIEEEKKEQ